MRDPAQKNVDTTIKALKIIMSFAATSSWRRRGAPGKAGGEGVLKN